MHFLDNIMIRLFSTQVGEDEVGNKYFIAKYKDNNEKYRRRIIYKNLPEPSKIPAMWHGWLHYIIDEIPKIYKYSWQGDHKPNLTGSIFSYQPLYKKDFNQITKIYEAWTPKGETE